MASVGQTRATVPVRFIDDAATFAAEVRSENDYSPSALADQADKRPDYFRPGTKVVWDVDPVAEVIHCYRAAAPTRPVEFRRGQTADAEPAVPGRTVAADEIFA